MSWSGKHAKGAKAARKLIKRAQAEARNLITPPERRRAFRTSALPA